MTQLNWKDIVVTINEAATRDGVPQWKLETIFQIGDGTGRVWRSWRNGERRARMDVQNRIIESAAERGWLNEKYPLLKNNAGKKTITNSVTVAAPSEKTKKNRKAWALVILKISNSLKNSELNSNAVLENYFNVGNGTGRVWTSWLNGERCARALTRERIQNEACKKGWLQIDKKLQKDIEALPDKHIHSMSLASQPFTDLPDPPDRDIAYPQYNARLAAQALLDDASRAYAGTLNKWRERAIKLCYPPEEQENIRNTWLATVKKIQQSADLNNKHEYEKVQINLIIAYRRQGYK